ncbi:hypothetical protein F4604DRAFT_1936768 [Suillus subluteus]|nr:hypothetical protein F4604DRAFT_1936768 [Suillus subluteus]
MLAQDHVPTNTFDTHLVPSPLGLEALPGPGCHYNKDSASSKERDGLGGDSESEEGGGKPFDSFFFKNFKATKFAMDIDTDPIIFRPNGIIDESQESNGTSVSNSISISNSTSVPLTPAVLTMLDLFIVSSQGELTMPNSTLNISRESNSSSILCDSSNINVTPVLNDPSASNATSVPNGIAISADVPVLTVSTIPTTLTVPDTSRVSVEDRTTSTNTTLPAESAECSTVSLDITKEAKPGEPSYIARFYDVLSRIITEAGYSLHNDPDTIENNVDMIDGTTSEQVQSVPLVDSSNVSSKGNEMPPIHATSLVRSSALGENNEPIDVYFVHPVLNVIQPGQPLPTKNIPPTPPSSTESFTPVEDIPKLKLPKPNCFLKMTPFYQVHPSTVLDSISPRDANTYLMSKVASLSDFHSVYFHHVANAIASYCFCQDQLISIDLEVEAHQNDDYPGHKTLTAGNIDLPSGGPCSQCDWPKRISEITDHHSHIQHLIHTIDMILSALMLSEASNMLPILKFNPFITLHEAQHFNAIITVARFHGEDKFASKLEDSLLMPFPDPNEDIMGAMAECDLLDTGSTEQILQFARDRDKVLNVKRSSIVVIATSPFRTEYFDGPSSLPSTWYELSGIDYDEEDFKGSEKCTRAPSKMV